jgi:uncharacterized membrane protein
VLVVVGGALVALAVAGTETTTVGGDEYTEPSVSTSFGAGSIAVLLVCSLLLIAASIYPSAAFLSGCLDIADGQSVRVGSFLKPRNVGPALLAALLLAILTAIGTLLCIIPGLILGFFGMFTIAFAIDRSLSPVDALKASVATVRSNVGGTLLSWLVQYAVLLVGELLCGVGLIVAFPVAILIQTYTYRRLSGGHVAPAG